MGRPLESLTDAAFVRYVEAKAREGRLDEIADEVYHENPHRHHLLSDDLRAAVKKSAEQSLIAAVQAWDAEGRPAEKTLRLWSREMRLFALVDAYPDLRVALRKAADEKEQADARARGIPVVKPRADVCVFTDRRLPFDQLRTRRPLLTRIPRLRQRGPRRRRAAGVRVSGSRRSPSRCSSRGGDSGDGPGEPEPDRGRLDDPTAGTGR